MFRGKQTIRKIEARFIYKLVSVKYYKIIALIQCPEISIVYERVDSID